jgi:glycosyltransferase involved in cell wall biosynthesis
MRKENILVLTYWSFNSALIQTYTLPYVYQIQKNISPDSRIFLLTLSENSGKNSAISKEQEEELLSRNINVINYNYERFGLLMTLRFSRIIPYLLFLIFRQRITILHSWCTPGGAIGYLLSIFSGRPLILDSFEPHAESMVETGTWKKKSFPFRILFTLEKLQLKRAKEVILTTPGMVEYSERAYHVKLKNYFVKPACVDLDHFDPDKNYPNSIDSFSDDNIVCVYAGKFGDLYLEKEVFDFFRIASEYWQGRFRVLLLTGHSDEEISAYCRASGFDRLFLEKRFVPHKDVPGYMKLGTFGICPMKPVPTKQYGTPIKNGEYWAMGLPVVITKNISVDSNIIEKENIGYVLESLTEKEYLKAVKKIDELIRETGLKYRIREIASKNRNFSISEKIYKAIYA